MFDTHKPLGSALPPRPFSFVFIILGFVSILIQFQPGHTPQRWDMFMGGLWIALGFLYLWGDRKQRGAQAAEAAGGWVAEAKGQLSSGDKTAAIKIVRHATGLGLVQAKQVVESWEEK